MLRPPFIGIFWRSFFLQAHWNYSRMQGTGFLFCLLPAARRLYQDPRHRIEFLKRHSRFFNAQPFCASLALGQVLRREMEALQNGSPEDAVALEDTVKCKDGLCGPLGLLGDQLFWQLLKPMAAALGMIAAFIMGGIGPKAALVGVGVFLLAFNPLHLWMRWWGLKAGYRVVHDLSGFLSTGALPKLRRWLAALGPYVALVLAVLTFTYSRREIGLGWIAFPVSFVLMLAALKWRWPLYRALSAVALICLLIAILRR